MTTIGHWETVDDRGGKVRCVCHLGQDHDAAPEVPSPRMARLEKVAELAQAYWSHQGWDEWNALGLALSDLDDMP